MSKKFEICSATYNIALNQGGDDVFRTGCAHLYHFLHGNGNNGRSEECKRLMLKMHLELNELIEETEAQIAEPSNSNNSERQFIQQLEAKLKTLEDALQANGDVVNKIIERMEKLENNISKNIVDKTPDVGNNTIDHDGNNALLSISDNATRQSTLQLETKLKTLEDAFQAKDCVVNKIIECIEKLKNNISKNIVDKTPDVGNNTIDHDGNNALLSISDNVARKSVQQLEEKLKTLEDALQAKDGVVNKIIERLEKKLEKNSSSNFVYKETDVGNNTIDHESNNTLLNSSDKAKRQSAQQIDEEIKDLKDRIEQLEHNKAVNETADIGNPTTPDNSTDKQQHQTNKHNSSQKQSNNGSDDHNDGKEYQTTPKENQEIQFYKDNGVRIMFIRSFHSSLETAIYNVIQLARDVGLTLTRDQIKHIDVEIFGLNALIYNVYFSTNTIKKELVSRHFSVTPI